MKNHSLVLEETRNTLDRQIEEIRDQRHQALRILRIYFTVASIIIVVLTAFITTSFSPPFELRLVESRVFAPILVLLGVLMLGRGLITFYRGVFHAFEVLSIQSVENHQWLRFVRTVIALIRGRDLPGRETFDISLGPDFHKIQIAGDVAPELIDENISNINTNGATIESNNEHLRQMYERMAGGITGFAIGLAILFLAL